MKLFLKGSRCTSDKCSFDRRAYAPGQHGQNLRRKGSEFGFQLREKQKMRRIYGILERQFHNYFLKASKQKGITGENLLVMLECRFDNIIYRLGLAPSRKAARQLILHRHLTVNNEIVDIASYQLKPGDIIQVREKSRNLDIIHAAMKDTGKGFDYPWLRLDKAKMEGELLEKPKRLDIPTVVQEQMVVELYSK